MIFISFIDVFKYIVGLLFFDNFFGTLIIYYRIIVL